MSKEYDVIIMGSGVVGASIALALLRNTNLKIALIDRAPQNPPSAKNASTPFTKGGKIKNSANIHSCGEGSRTQQVGGIDPLFKGGRRAFCARRGDLPLGTRVSAISPASQKWFEHLSCWTSIKEKGVSPYTDMHIWDATNQNTMHFDCQSVNASELGFIIENDIIQDSIIELLSLHPHIDLLHQEIAHLHSTPDAIALSTENDETLLASLLIGADGAHSWVRERNHIVLKKWRHTPRTAIVATVETTLPHQETARQIFLPDGPLAFLPLQNPHHCSIVWSPDSKKANALMTLNDKEFSDQLKEAFGSALGSVALLSIRHTFPLQTGYAATTIHPRVALIGDAAHTIHPLAGQGMNLGLADAACLAEIIIDAHQKNQDIASQATLRRYERARKTETLAMLAGIEAIHALFSAKDKKIETIRSIGWKGIDRCSFVKNFLVQIAMGNRS